MSEFNYKEFQEKVDFFKKAMDDINTASKKLQEDLEKPVVKKPQDHLPAITKEKPKDSGSINNSVHTGTTYINQAISWDDVNESVVIYNAKGEGAVTSNPEIAINSQIHTNHFKNTWKKASATWNPEPIKQNFGTYTPQYSNQDSDFYNSASFDSLEEKESESSSFNSQLIATVVQITIDMYGASDTVLKSKKGKEGQAIVFGSYDLKAKNKAYVWWISKNCWVEVEHSELVNHWAMVQMKNTPNTFNNDILTVGYTQKYIPPPSPTVQPSSTGNLLAPPPIDWGIPVVIKEKTIAEQITKLVKQKTKPSKPFNGLAWFNINTGWTKLYQKDKWVDIKVSDVNEYAILQLKNISKKTETNQAKKAKIETSYWFRANCGNWHEVVNPEKNIIKSINGNYTWFHSSESSEFEYSCGHDNMRAMPCFTSEEKKIKLDEIKAKQSGNFNESYWIQSGQYSMEWEEVHAKQTIKIGDRAFHHNSGNKVWYICLSYKEMIEAKAGVTFSTYLKEDMKNIFIDAIPANKFGYSWFMDGTVQKKNKKDTAAQMQQELLDHVQNKANELYYKKNGQQKKKLVKDMNLSSSYQLDISDYTDYMNMFNYIYDNEYSYSDFKQKAIQLHKYFMHDLKLSMIKKDKKRFNICIEHLEILQEKFNEVEAWNVSTNMKNAFWLKPLSKVQNMWNYHFDNPYGVDKE